MHIFVCLSSVLVSVCVCESVDVPDVVLLNHHHHLFLRSNLIIISGTAVTTTNNESLRLVYMDSRCFQYYFARGHVPGSLVGFHLSGHNRPRIREWESSSVSHDHVHSLLYLSVRPQLPKLLSSHHLRHSLLDSNIQSSF